MDAINRLVENKQGVLDQLSENLTKAITLTDALSPDAIQIRLDELQQRLIQSAQNKENYDALADRIYRLKEQKQAAQTSLAQQKETKKKIKPPSDSCKNSSQRLPTLTKPSSVASSSALLFRRGESRCSSSQGWSLGIVFDNLKRKRDLYTSVIFGTIEKPNRPVVLV